MAQLSQTCLSQVAPISSGIFDDKNIAITEANLVVLILNENGLILYFNEAATKLLGCSASQLGWQPASKFLPQLTNNPPMLNGKLNPRLSFLSRVGHVFEVKSLEGNSSFNLLFFYEIELSGQHSLCLVISPVEQDILSS